MSLESNQLVPYVPPQEGESVDVPEIDTSGAVLLYRDTTVHNDSPPVEQIERMKRWRKRKGLVAGVGIGVILLVALGPAGGIAGGLAGGIAGAYAVKKALKRREKKVIDRLMALQYPLQYNRHAVFA